MLHYKTILFYFTSALMLNSCASSAQISGIKVVEENQDKKYTLIKTGVFKDEATILRDTTNKYNRYPSEEAIGQYIPSFTDVEMFEDILKSSLVSNEQVVAQDGETFAKHYRKFNRQYSGYIDKLGDTILVVNFLEFKKKKEAKEVFFNWKYQNSFYGSVLYLHKKTPSIYCYALNIGTKSLSRYKEIKQNIAIKPQ